MREHIASDWRPDGHVIYRRDSGRLVGLMPERCKRGEHVLSTAGCVPRVESRGYPHQAEQLLVLTCPACAGADHSWYLVVDEQPEAAEWSATAYGDIEPVLSQQPASDITGRERAGAPRGEGSHGASRQT